MGREFDIKYMRRWFGGRKSVSAGGLVMGTSTIVEEDSQGWARLADTDAIANSQALDRGPMTQTMVSPPLGPESHPTVHERKIEMLEDKSEKEVNGNSRSKGGTSSMSPVDGSPLEMSVL